MASADTTTPFVGHPTEAVRLFLTEGDHLGFSLASSDGALPSPVTLWVGGRLFEAEASEDGAVATFALAPEEVNALIDAGVKVGQIDLGTSRTILVRVVAQRTPRTDD